MHLPAEARLDSRQPDEFASQLEPYAAERVTIEPRTGGFRAAARAWGLGEIRLFQVAIEHARVLAPPSATALSLSMPLSSPFAAVAGARKTPVAPGACFVRDDTRAMDTDVPSSAVFVANFDWSLLGEKAGKLAGGAPAETFRTEPLLPLARAEGVRLWRRLTSIWRDLANGAPWLRSAPAMAQAKSELVEALIDAVGDTGSKDAPPCGQPALRRAEEFVLARLGEPISRADICAAAGVGVRSLSRAFQRRYGIGPMTFLRERRLDAAQRLLMAADPAEHKVTDIALDCGFHHFGRFSVGYRCAFGESPSETLRGSPRGGRLAPGSPRPRALSRSG